MLQNYALPVILYCPLVSNYGNTFLQVTFSSAALHVHNILQQFFLKCNTLSVFFKQSLDGILKGFLRLSIFSCLKMCFIAVHCLRQHDKNVITNCCFPIQQFLWMLPKFTQMLLNCMSIFVAEQTISKYRTFHSLFLYIMWITIIAGLNLACL